MSELKIVGTNEYIIYDDEPMDDQFASVRIFVSKDNQIRIVIEDEQHPGALISLLSDLCFGESQTMLTVIHKMTTMLEKEVKNTDNDSKNTPTM